MDSFFASVEQHLRPELRGRPVGVIPVESKGTCVIAASVEAKSLGVRTGTRVAEARELCPSIELIRARPAVYVEVHHCIAEAIETCAPVHKAYSIDEWAVRLQGDERTHEGAAALAHRMKDELVRTHSEFLPCSIGIAPTRLLAKIAADLGKPNGLELLDPADLPDRLDTLRLKDLCGISGGIGTRLTTRGVRTVRDLWALTRRECVEAWGSSVGGDWWAGFHGHDEPEIKTMRRSMSHANVLSPEFRNPDGARGILTRLVCRLGTRLRHAECVASSLHVHIHFASGASRFDDTTLPQVQDTPALLGALDTLWRRSFCTMDRPLKVGATVSGLMPVSQVPGRLFEQADRGDRISKAVDTVTRRWGISSLYFGAMHEYRHHMDDKIAFGRIPSRVGHD